MRSPVLRRRTLLALPLLAAGCSAPSPSAAPQADPPPTSPAPQIRHDRLAELERTYDARLGLYALDTATGVTVTHRPDERFAFCSAFKGLAVAAVLRRNPLSHLDTRVTYTRDDLLPNAAITRDNLATGMTIGELCDAAVRFSDGTAGNLLLRDLGGPAELTAFARELGDTVTRMDRIEPDIVEATPGDPRDTSSPRAFGTSYQAVLLGDTLPPAARDRLLDLMERNATEAGTRRIRAGTPPGWVVADKTGTGDHATLVDVAVVRPPGAAPIVLSIMSSRAEPDADSDQTLIAEAAAYTLGALG